MPTRRTFPLALGLCLALWVSPLRIQAQAPHHDHDHLLYAVAWMQHAPEYRALCHQIFNMSRLQLDQLLRQERTRTPAIVLDLDETVLDNTPVYADRIVRGKVPGEAGWGPWIDSANAQPLPGALEFLRYAEAQGVQIFYITNRSDTLRDFTLRNLQRVGFPFADHDHLLMKAKDFNKLSRRQVVAREYDIVMLFGDNLNDLSELFYYGDGQVGPHARVEELRAEFGRRFIVLPNPMYGSWTKMLNRERGINDGERARRSLRQYR